MNLIIEPSVAEKDIQNMINNILNMICESNISLKIDCIILGGGFGRGEGSVKKINNTYETTNDYDFFVITKENNFQYQIDDLVCNIEKKLDLKFFGIDVLVYDDLIKLLNKKTTSQSFYDFLYGSQILWENKKNIFSYKELFDKYKNERFIIKKQSSFDVLRTRLWCLLALIRVQQNSVSYDCDFKYNYEFFQFQIIKAATAIVDSVLIIENKYNTCRFKEKLEIFRNSDFYKTGNYKLIYDLIYKKIHNIKITEEEITISDYKEIVNSYISCCEFIISKNKIFYFYYLIIECIYIYLYKFRKRTFCKCSFEKYKYLKYIYMKYRDEKLVKKLNKFINTIRY
ncbi:hypothetical protein [Clostridium butyricum]